MKDFNCCDFSINDIIVTVEHKIGQRHIGVGNRRPGFGQAQQCDGVKPVNGIS
jgi:hypothetical protein